MKSLIISDDVEISCELLTYLRDKMDLDLISIKNDEVLYYGAGNVYFFDDPLENEISKRALEISKDYDYIFASSTVLGRSVAGYLSAAMNKIAIPEIISIEFNDTVKTRRYFYGGKTILEEESDARIFTVQKGISDKKRLDNKSREQDLKNDGNVNIIDRTENRGSSSNIENARIIVSVGRGLSKKEDINIVEPLARVLNAEIAGSRPLCLDLKWLPEDRQVGISGKKVRPDVYIAIGISGQIQHIAGMRDSKIVIAINKDENAPIFDECDYGIVGDLYRIVPELVKKLS
ncbi:electron transfer flavoprotein subunit alpha/FixB family protein [Picrophilus oshimae]|uniref:Electron transfer flavoprotein alpha subunit n=1 Tax=Picrophilus torridus (strain ATCC 700027 / DSM 9790 / JCM 10055 / NBRC 100828 / KAW 2/3) TaxID=1122961 RepID=Q6L2D5_PICTO|nr:electron transfer flavoprotein subunit alpha/FixB family protein [Picrophilus oshimae]AAT42867.1 electron transfer flavoprotein alpha subunit [Picrophilus oshimae DSM 9789]SMD31628.1 electron transfer flavoprotein alpha subunit apoprotein [Picrophilus oshimae DSM 9789]